MAIMLFLKQALTCTHPSWHDTLLNAFGAMDQHYLNALSRDSTWLPGIDKLLNAFSLPFNETRWVLYGESPYPRALSANGYAFWDAAVGAIWSSTGLSTAVNRATSLRNFIKMLLVAEGTLTIDHTKPTAIAALDKRPYCRTLKQLFKHLIQHGFLLLNASLVLSTRPKVLEARLWLPFQNGVLTALSTLPQPPELLLFGKIADTLQHLAIIRQFPCLIAEHPYNLSFISNPDVLAFFKALNLLQCAT